MVEAARMAEAAGPDIIDINFGCPMKKIAGRGAGSGMMRDVPLMVEMTRRIVRRSTTPPVTVKTRLGWDDENKNIEEIALRFAGRGDRSARSTAAPRPDLPGRSRLDAHRSREEQSRDPYPDHRQRRRGFGPRAAAMFDRYGVDGVMIGRATTAGRGSSAKSGTT